MEYKFTDELLVSIVPLQDVAKLYGPVDKRGAYYYSQCPNPDCAKRDERKTFEISENKTYAKCYHCDWYAYDSIHYVAKREGVNREQARKIIIEKFNINIKDGKITSLKSYQIKSKVEKKKANPEILDEIYSLFLNSSELIGNKKLAQDDYEYLVNRGVEPKFIEEYGFASMPTRAVMPEFCRILEERDLLKHLRFVPGFFRRIDFNDYFFNYVPAILIPIKNEFNQIVGIQIRNKYLLSEYSKRYFWFSSNYDEKTPNEKGYYDGTSSGTPLGLVRAYKIDKNNNIISNLKTTVVGFAEGLFKADVIAKRGQTCITIQGVNGIDPFKIIEMLDNMRKIDKIYYTTFCIYFDADMIHNTNVIKAALKIADIVSRKYPTVVAQWDEEKGKGIDDYFNEGYDENGVYIVNYSIFKEYAEKFCADVKKYSIKDKDEMIEHYKKLANEHNVYI